MDKQLKGHLESIFSLLPDEKADRARKELLKRLASGARMDADELKWADFEAGGRFVRGGITSVHDLSTRIITSSQSDPDIHELVRHAGSGTLEPGDLVWVPSSERIFWYVPFLPSRSGPALGARLRGLSFTFALFKEVVGLFNAGLTSKEWWTVFQIVAGIPLRRAASDDGVSYETKRAHVKSACDKLNCAGQKEMVQKVMGQLAYAFSLSDTESTDAEVAETFVSRYLSNDVRLIVRRLEDGRTVRYLESGPADGTPVIMIHGIMFPISLYGIAAELERARIRVIMPIRQGFLESRSVSALFREANLLETSIDEIADLLGELGMTPAVILGNSLGGLAAIRFANRYPQLVSHLVVLSVNLARTAPSDKNQAGPFYAALHGISDRPELFRFVNWHFKTYYADETTCRQILLRLFGDSGTDSRVLEGTYTKVPAYAMFSDTYQTSIVGIAEDFKLSGENWAGTLDRLQVPVTLIHGTEDPLTSINELAALAAAGTSGRIHGVAGGGHFISVSHAREVWQKVAELARDRDRR